MEVSFSQQTLSSKGPGFSIVICTYNGKSRLTSTLTHLAALAVPTDYAAELLLVDNASTDGTAAFAQELWHTLGKPFPLTTLPESRPGKGYAVETGYDAARYSYILTVDDDNWLQADYLIQAAQLLESDPAVGILQGKSTGVFEAVPPDWAVRLEKFFIIGSPVEQPGYFPIYSFYVWGAGMVLRTADWQHLRSLGFSALTSKMPGKAAGEDNELALGLLLMGRKIYYSDKLAYGHYMPAARITWEKLIQNVYTLGYVNYYFFLYWLVVKRLHEGETGKLTASAVTREFAQYWLKLMRRFTLKQHAAYYLRPNKEEYQLTQLMYRECLKWFFRLRKDALRDIASIRGWMVPLLEQSGTIYRWPF